MSIRPLQPNEGAQDDWLRNAFDEWDAGEPSAAGAWDAVDESLSVESVWSRVGQSLTTAEHAPDGWITAAHSEWNPEPEHDMWAKLNDSISLEQVWSELDQTLSQPVTTRFPVWKMAAACLIALFFTQRFSDSPVQQYATAFSGIPALNAPVVDSPVSPATNVQPNLAEVPSVTGTAPANERRQQAVPHNGQPEPQNGTFTEQRQLIVQHPEPHVQEPRYVEPVVANTTLAAADDLLLDSLEKRNWSTATGSVYPTAFAERPPVFTNWALQVGTQVSILEEREQEMLTSTFPRLGLAADVSFRHRLGPVQLIHALGMSQYAQGTGRYDNGRYFNTQQRLNTLQLSSSVGYTFNRFTFYGGVLFSKMLSGLEQKKNAVTKVYNFDQVQAGFTGGVDYRLKTFRVSGSSISLGTQYQVLPSGGSKTSFASIQGIRFQAKFSF